MLVALIIVGSAGAQSDILLQCRCWYIGVLLVANTFVVLAHDQGAGIPRRLDQVMHK